MMIFVSSISGQKSLDKLFKSYANSEDITYIKMDGSMLSYIIKDGMKSKLKKLDVVIMDKEHNNLTKTDFTNMKNSAKSNGFEELIMTRHKGANIQVLSKDKKDYLESIFITVQSEENSILIKLKGRIFFEEIKDLNLGVEGTDFFSDIFGAD